jgi:hypothetical protein
MVGRKVWRKADGWYAGSSRHPADSRHYLGHPVSPQEPAPSASNAYHCSQYILDLARSRSVNRLAVKRWPNPESSVMGASMEGAIQPNAVPAFRLNAHSLTWSVLNHVCVKYACVPVK